MVDGYQVSEQELTTHANAIDTAVLAKVRKAADAAGQAKLGDSKAYGILLQFVIPPILEGLVGDAEGGLQSQHRLGEAIVTGVRTCAKSYEADNKDGKNLVRHAEEDGGLRW